jgi:hypothetical protein
MSSVVHETVIGWGANDWIAVAGLLQVVVLIGAALYAKRQVDETRKLRRPYVIAYAELSPVSRILINLVIRNIGQAPAYDTTVTFNPSLASSISDEGITWSAIVGGIPFLAPQQEMTHLLDSAISLYGKRDAVPMQYTVTVVSHDRPAPSESRWWSKRKTLSETYVIDLGVWFGSHYTTEKGVHHVAEALEEVQKSLKSWTEHLDGLKVYVLDHERVEAEIQAVWKQRASATAEDRTPPSQSPAGGG